MVIIKPPGSSPGKRFVQPPIPRAFPNSFREGLQPWQAKKLYMDNVRGTEDWTIELENFAVRSPARRNVRAICVEGPEAPVVAGRAGGWTLPEGRRTSYYKLIDSVLPNPPAAGAHEKDFFDGIDTSLPGLASRLGVDQAKVFLAPAAA